MNAPVPKVTDTKSSTTLDKLDGSVLVAKAPWYKEAAGLVAVMAWLAIITVNMWAIFFNSTIPQPISLAILYSIALGSSALRNSSAKVTIQRMEL